MTRGQKRRLQSLQSVSGSCGKILSRVYSLPRAAIKNCHKPYCLKQQKFILSQFCRSEALNQGVSRSQFPLEALGKELPASSSFRWPHVFLTCGLITPVSASVFAWPPPLSLCVTSCSPFSCQDTSHCIVGSS